MSTFPSELQSILTPRNPSANDQNSEGSYEQHVQQQVATLGPEPSLTQVATLLLMDSARAEHEAKQARLEISRNLVKMVKVVKNHHTDIELRHNTVVESSRCCPQPLYICLGPMQFAACSGERYQSSRLPSQ